MLFSTVADAYARLEATAKRLEMTDLLAALLRETPADVIDKVVYLTQGRIVPDFEDTELGLAEKLVTKALAQTAGTPQAHVEAVWKARGDLGLVAEEIIATKAQRSLFGEALTVEKVHGNLLEIARAAGYGSQEDKMDKLQELLMDATPLEARYLVRTVVGKMRLGVADMTVIDALAQAYAAKEDRDAIERAYNVSSDLGQVARALAAGGLAAVKEIRLKLGVPLRAMLCERLESLEAILERLGKCAFEYKYDGLRVQAHLGPTRVQLFSRQLEDITAQFPEVVDGLRAAVKAKACIIEGEAVPVDPNTGTFLPFQQVSRRRGRKHGLEAAVQEFPVTLFAFDCLFLDGDDLTEQAWRRRRKALEKVVRPNDAIRLGEVLVADGAKAAQGFFDAALESGCEGLVAKALESKYEAGARGFQWIKYKRDYKSEMTDTVDLVVVGAFAGRGKRAGTYGALLCAAYDRRTDTFYTACKLGTGFDDATLFALPQRFEPHKVKAKPARVESAMKAEVWFEPAVVLEVLGAELTLSPVHTAAMGKVRKGAGLAVRFPRFTGKWREDRKAEDATSVGELLKMYRQQLRKVEGA